MWGRPGPALPLNALVFREQPIQKLLSSEDRVRTQDFRDSLQNPAQIFHPARWVPNSLISPLVFREM